jgi:predicted transcriptional regulator with HTH domain
MEDIREHGIELSDVEYSLRRSKVRHKILLFMDKVGKEASAHDISIGIGVCYSSVYGGLHGNGRHYSKDNSLLGMELVEARHLENNLILYSLTETGRDAVRSMKLREGSHDRDIRLDQEV